MKYNAYTMPPRLFKYYRFDDYLNKKRLSGEMYLATPFDFNDPCDCQRDVDNNSNKMKLEKGDGWLEKKLTELGYSETESPVLVDKLLSDDKKTVYDIYKRQLERVGILCFTPNHADTLMWGYYANNDGFCIEYDTKKLMREIVIGFINELSYEDTRRLFEERRYCDAPISRTILSSQQISKLSIWGKQEMDRLTNAYLIEHNDPNEKINFMQNVFLKRVSASQITYNVSTDGSPSTLFFDKNDKKSFGKYFIKTKTWKHEDEFRVVVSLGGKKLLRMDKSIIKNIYVGCNMSNEKVVGIACLMNELSLKGVNLYKMCRLKNCGLQAKSVKIEQPFWDNLTSLNEQLTSKNRLYW